MALTFPDSSESPFVAPNGVTYVWNTDGYWEASLDGAYLSKLTDDTAAGAITFEGITTHEAGVRVTGTDPDANTIALRVATDTEGDNLSGIRASGGYTGTLTNYYGFYAESGGAAGSATNNYGFYTRGTLTDWGDNNYGFFSNVGKGSKNNYAIYTANTATSFFNGGIQFDDTAGASVLDHYEEGTFTAEFELDTGLTFKEQKGNYTIVGNVCIATYFLSWNAGTSSLNENLRLKLPFVAAFNTQNYRSASALGFTKQIPYSGQLVCSLSGGTGVAVVFDLLPGGGAQNKKYTDISGSGDGQIQTTIVYQIA